MRPVLAKEMSGEFCMKPIVRPVFETLGIIDYAEIGVLL
jgi:hypothetical protein